MPATVAAHRAKIATLLLPPMRRAGKAGEGS